VLRSAIILTLVTLALAGRAHAQSAPVETPSEGGETVGDQAVESTRRARDEFRAGVEHYQAGRYVEAIHSFQVAASLVPSADLWFNIASAYEQLSRGRGEITDFEQAIAHYRRYLTERVDPPDRAAVEGTIAVLTERLEAARAAQTSTATEGTLRIRSEVEGAEVRVDGDVVGQTPIDRELRLAPGRHRLEASRSGYLPYSAEVSVELGLTVTSPIALSPARTHRSITGTPIFAWVAWGLGVASLAGSVVTGVMAQGRIPSDMDPCLMSRLPSGASEDCYAGARDMGALSDGLLAATAGLAVVGIALYFLEGNAVGTVTERGGVVEE
jgi:hypothetical protein